MRALICLFACTGCDLYFETSSTHDDRVIPGDACGASPDAKVCPAIGTIVEISYPLDGATGVGSPVPIRWRTVIPNTLDGRGAYLTDAANNVVPLDHWNASCSTAQPWNDWIVSCYDLAPDTQYTWRVFITCYDASGAHELATSTFRTAP